MRRGRLSGAPPGPTSRRYSLADTAPRWASWPLKGAWQQPQPLWCSDETNPPSSFECEFQSPGERKGRVQTALGQAHSVGHFTDKWTEVRRQPCPVPQPHPFQGLGCDLYLNRSKPERQAHTCRAELAGGPGQPDPSCGCPDGDCHLQDLHIRPLTQRAGATSPSRASASLDELPSPPTREAVWENISMCIISQLPS